MAGSPRSLSDATTTTIFCDFDGPVVDVSDRYYSTYHLALADTARFYRESSQGLEDISLQPNLRILSKEQFWDMKQNRIPDREIARQSGLQDEEIDFFIRRVVKIVNCRDLLQLDRIQTGASWALKLLHSEGFQLVLVTLRDRTEATQMLKEYGVLGLFSGIYGSDNCQAAYQNHTELKTQFLARAIAECDTQASQNGAWIVGDTEADLLAGKAMQIQTMGLTCGIRSYHQLSLLQPTTIETNLLLAARYLVEINSPQLCTQSR
jgi:phosphoglycolate phosphatase